MLIKYNIHLFDFKKYEQSIFKILTFQYRATDFLIPGAGQLEIKWTAADGSSNIVHTVNDFKGPGVAIGMYNTDESIR